jgi:hypothetical protein
MQSYDVSTSHPHLQAKFSQLAGNEDFEWAAAAVDNQLLINTAESWVCTMLDIFQQTCHVYL